MNREEAARWLAGYLARTYKELGTVEQAFLALTAVLADEELARVQPCGCVVCYCENQERCLGCGAKKCGGSLCVFEEK